jgi:hypothetical protein
MQFAEITGVSMVRLDLRCRVIYALPARGSYVLPILWRDVWTEYGIRYVLNSSLAKYYCPFWV